MHNPRTSLRTLARNRLAGLAGQDQGFTLIEMIVTLAIIAVAFTSLSFVLMGTLSAYGSSRLRSAFVEIGNAEVEQLRAGDYDELGVRTTDPDYASAYPFGMFEGRDAVTVTAAGVPEAVSTVTTASTPGLTLPYTVRRWVTWTDVTPNTLPDDHLFKRLTVSIEWSDRGATHTFRLASVRYPGGIGSPNGPANSFPTAAVSVTAPFPLQAGATVSFSGSGSSDADGDPLTFEWNFGDGTAHVIGTPTTTHIYSLAGTYSASLTVSDGRGGVDAALHDFVVVTPSGNQAPVASFSLSGSSGVAPYTVNFDASGSSDPDGSSDLVSYSWDWGDGTTNGSGINASHVFTTVGAAATYSVTLTLTDMGNLIGTTAQTVTVTPLTCTILDGSFNNPSTNATANDIPVGSSKKPTNSQFAFTATTNTACTSVTMKLTESSGSWIVTLTNSSTSGSVKTWTLTQSISSSAKFNVGNNQTGYVLSPLAAGEATYTFSYNVH